MSDTLIFVNPVHGSPSVASINLEAVDISQLTKNLARFSSTSGPAVAHMTVSLPPIYVCNVPFHLRREEGSYILESGQHPALSVFGSSLAEVAREAFELLGALFEEYVLAPEEDLSEDAQELRSYLISKMLS